MHVSCSDNRTNGPPPTSNEKKAALGNSLSHRQDFFFAFSHIVHTTKKNFSSFSAIGNNNEATDAERNEANFLF